jgi:hypothetical protein
MNNNSDAAEKSAAVEGASQSAHKGDGKQQEKKAYPFPVSNAILKNYRRMKDAIWLYLYYIDRTTEDYTDPEGTTLGRVLFGRACLDEDAASAIDVTDRTIRTWRSQLSDGGYIRQKRTGRGYIIEVVNSQKWSWRKEKATRGERKEIPGQAYPDRKEPSGQTGISLPIRPEAIGKSDDSYPYRQNRDSTGTETPTAPKGAGDVRAPLEKVIDPRFAPVRTFYVSEFEKRNPGVKAVFDGSDGKALNALLAQQPEATAETIIGWIRNAYSSDDTPPLRKGFRFRQFVAFHTQYSKGALCSDGVKQPHETLSWRERDRLRTTLTPEGKRLYERAGIPIPSH